MEVGGVMVSFSTGVMESVLRKLQILATEVADSKPKGLGAEITGLKGELESINTNLQAFAKMREPIGPAKQWMKQVRETVFDIDDWADLYRTDREADRHVGIVKVLKQKLKNLGGGKNEPPNNQIHEFKQLVQEANERFKRYELLQRTSSNSVEQTALPFVEDAQDPRERALHAEETALVGIHGPTEDLLASLLPCDDTGEPAVKDLKVVFLVGSGGLGKTTLAKQVLRQPRLQLEFQPRVFVHVGRNPCEKAVLMGILNQVRACFDTWIFLSGGFKPAITVFLNTLVLNSYKVHIWKQRLVPLKTRPLSAFF
jgi:disease resistance protein RPM1